MKKIILTEDIKAVLEKDRSFFNRSGIRSIAAETNEEILALHKAEKADLIITNLGLPGRGGDDLCSLIRNDEALRSVSIIIVCSETTSNLRRCAQCGANTFIASPVNTAVLLQEAYQLLHVTPRRSCRIPLKLRMEGTSREKPFSGHAHNVSASGMLFQSSAIFFEGDTIQCSFSLPGPVRITANAEIVRVSKTKESDATDTLYGIRFSDLNDADISVLNTYVNSNSMTNSGR